MNLEAMFPEDNFDDQSPDFQRLSERLTVKLNQEIQQRKELETRLEQLQNLLFAIVNNSLDGIAILEAVRNQETGRIENFRCLVINHLIAKIFGGRPDDFIGKLHFKKIINKIAPHLFNNFVKVVETGQPLKQQFYDNQKNFQWFDLNAAKLGDGFSIIVRDITESKNLELKLQSLTTIDELTGIASHRQFDLILFREWKRCQRDQQFLSLILIELDYFLEFRDFYGDHLADICLKKVANTIDNTAKRSTDLAARYDQEKFGIILPNTDNNGGVIMAETIIKQIADLQIDHQASEIKDYLTVSIGIATILPNLHNTTEILIDTVEKALEEAKLAGRNCYYSY
jgi:two-component system, cell cycle response regulator